MPQSKVSGSRVILGGLAVVVRPLSLPVLHAIVFVARQLTAWRVWRGRPSTVWGTTPILTLPLLARCDRSLGLASQSLVYLTYHISSAFDVNLNRISRLALRRFLAYQWLTWLVFLYALLRYDVFHFFNDRGFLVRPGGGIGLSEFELQLLRRAGKRIYTYAYGADVRTRNATQSLGPLNFCMDCVEVGRYCICDDAAGAANMEMIGRYVNGAVAMADMVRYVPHARVFHYWPIDMSEAPSFPPARPEGALRVFHAPNHTHFKGSAYLQKAINRLQTEGYAIELMVVQGKTNAEVIQAMRQADVVAEQFIGGAHGYTAVEAWSIGKPVICYIRNRDVLADPDTCPFINAGPDDLYEELKKCLLGHYDLEEMGRQGRLYVIRHYSREAVAIKLGQMYLTTASPSPAWKQVIESRVTTLGEELKSRIESEITLNWMTKAPVEHVI
ncbi:hypothetical protein [Ferrovibrio sp.]|uniref:hypothetical protein n=1 Tax=Ferrovibrio sp. TaxID=1917215 RepID=UPI0035AFD337